MAVCAILAICALTAPGGAAFAADALSIDAGANALELGEGGLGEPIGREIWVGSDSTVEAHLRMRFDLYRLEDASAVGASWADPECGRSAWTAADDGWWYMAEPLAPGARVEVATELSVDDAAEVYGRLQGGASVHLREIVTIEATAEEGAWDDPARIQASSDADAGGPWPKTGAEAGPRNRAMALAALLALAAYAIASARKREDGGE